MIMIDPEAHKPLALSQPVTWTYKFVTSERLLPPVHLPLDMVSKSSIIVPGINNVIYPWMIRVNGKFENLQVAVTNEADFMARIGDPTVNTGIRLEDYGGIYVIGEPLDFRLQCALHAKTNGIYYSYMKGLLNLISSNASNLLESKVQFLAHQFMITRPEQGELTYRVKEGNIRRRVYLDETYLIIFNKISDDEVSIFHNELTYGDHQNVRYNVIQFANSEECFKVSSKKVIDNINAMINRE